MYLGFRFKCNRKKYSLMLATIISVLSSGCSSWLIRQECEKINWHDHAYNLAMKGKRLSGDPIIERCRKAEFEISDRQLDIGFKEGMNNYCKPDVVYATGRKGQTFNYDFCDPNQISLLKRKHAEGVAALCTARGGYDFGAAGNVYTNICSKDAEEVFMPEYKKGRKKYLTALSQELTSQMSSQEQEISRLERERNNLAFQKSMIPQPRTVVERRYDSALGRYTEESKTVDPMENERRRIESEINSVSNRINTIYSKKEETSKKLQETRSELVTLD